MIFSTIIKRFRKYIDRVQKKVYTISSKVYTFLKFIDFQRLKSNILFSFVLQLIIFRSCIIYFFKLTVKVGAVIKPRSVTHL